MGTTPKRIRFVEVRDGVEKRCYVETNDGETELGEIVWYRPWRRFVLATPVLGELVFDAQCLRDIAEHIERQEVG